MFKQLMRRKDTRVEIIGVTVVFLLIMALAFSGRTSQVSRAIAPPAGLPLRSAAAGSWTVDLVRLEDCPARKIVVAVIRVKGPALSDLGSHISNVEAPGLQFDGGSWSDAAARPLDVPFAGACGGWERIGALRGEGFLILRLRGIPALRSLPLQFRLQNHDVRFPPTPPSPARNSPGGLVGAIFGR